MEEKEGISEVIDAYLAVFGNKWNLLILNELFNGPKRFNELKRVLSPITQTVLVRHLKTLEEMSIINRETIASSPVSVYYSISDTGFLMIPSMIASYSWITENIINKKRQ